MDEHSVHKPLLQNGDVDTVHYKNSPLYVSAIRWFLKIVMWVSLVAWIALMFLYPSEFGSQLVRKLEQGTSGTVFGITGSYFLLFSGPVVIIAFLSVAHLIFSGEEELQRKKTSKHPCFQLWTFPVLVDGPFGVVSAAEFIGILLFVVFIFWAVYAYTMRNIGLLSEFQVPSKEQSIFLLELTGLRLGMIGLICLAFLFLPVARGSVLLRLIDIPFEHATRYHVWLGHLTMLLFTLHGLFYVIAWAIQGRLLQELMDWRNIGIANLPGVISLLAGLMMWVTSLHPVRKHYFELFFYTHQLYVVFVVFLALHVGPFIFSIAAGGIFLFILDRFLRFCQSRRNVDVLSASCLPCGTVELVLSKPANLRYNALSFIFLQVQELSWLQWHPFSVSSSPLDGKYHLSILIKVLGEWTAKLRENILSISGEEPPELATQPHTKITASVEGPYGHEVPYHLMYENLILVAGGIGISPFLAILSDILHRIKEGKPCLPRNVLIVWAVKKSNELPLLSNLDMESRCPFFSENLNLETCIYVTRETEPPLEEGKLHRTMSASVYPVSNGCSMSVLVGTGHNIWSGLYVISSTVGFIILVALVNTLYLNPFNISSWWYKGLLFLACMVAGVLIFGGPVIGLWHLWERKCSAREEFKNDDIKVNEAQNVQTMAHDDLRKKDPKSFTVVLYGTRPDFKEIFESVSKKWGAVDVGVIVCGPPTLQSSVAKEIRAHSITRESDHPIFHFNSHSFDL